MKDFANRNNKKNSNIKNKHVFRSKKPNTQTISSNTIIFFLIICLGLSSTSFLYFKTDVISIKPEDSVNSVTIDFQTSLKKDSILRKMVYEEDLYNIVIGPLENEEANNLVLSFISKGYKKTEIILN